MENEQIPTDNQPGAVTGLREEYLSISAAIVKKAKDNGRALLVEEARTLRELALAIRDLDKLHKPVKQRLIIVGPKDKDF